MNSQGYSSDDLDYGSKMAESFPFMLGPPCEYWSVQEAPMCGHASCYAIVVDLDLLSDLQGDPDHDICAHPHSSCTDSCSCSCRQCDAWRT